jgi:hypothetical protein
MCERDILRSILPHPLHLLHAQIIFSGHVTSIYRRGKMAESWLRMILTHEGYYPVVTIIMDALLASDVAALHAAKSSRRI